MTIAEKIEEKKKKTFTKKAVIAAVAIGFVVGVLVTRSAYRFLEDNVPYSYRGSLSDIYLTLLPTKSGLSNTVYTALAKIERRVGIENTFMGV